MGARTRSSARGSEDRPAASSAAGFRAVAHRRGAGLLRPTPRRPVRARQRVALALAPRVGAPLLPRRFTRRAALDDGALDLPGVTSPRSIAASAVCHKKVSVDSRVSCVRHVAKTRSATGFEPMSFWL